jgi:molybdopterin molybdotransferase
VQSALQREGLDLAFWKIAMRPGKPMMFGALGGMLILGLPGNPVSSYACGILFMSPLIRAMLGDPDAGRDRSEPAIAGDTLAANDQRMDFLRSALDLSGPVPVASPFAVQDSSMIGVLARAEALLIRPPHAPAAPKGALCRILRLGG